MKRTAAAMALGLLLVACGGEQYQDLKEEMKKIASEVRGRVDPLPVVKPYEPVPYTAAELPDPFGPAKIELVTKTSGGGGRLKPNMNRPREPLESFPLESLKMVGVLTQKKQMHALVRADGNLYRVRAGNYLGQNFGLITGITDTQIQLRETIQDASGDWGERASTLQLQEAAGGK